MICITLNDLLDRHKLTKIDILVIDTGGHDFEIIKSIDFTSIKPKIIIFEFVHMRKKDYKHCRGILKRNNYDIFLEELDIIAVWRPSFP